MDKGFAGGSVWNVGTEGDKTLLENQNLREEATRPSHAGRTALVTGAGRGIGAAIAKRLAGRHAKVGVIDVTLDDAEGVAAEIRNAGGAAVALGCDVSSFDGLKTACAALEDKLGATFDIVVNNAGISPKHSGVAAKVWEMSAEEWARVIAVNLGGCFNTIRLLSPRMIERGGGAIVNISSLAGRTFTPVAGCHYAASKAGIIGLTRHAAGELAPFNIRVNAIAPGRINTPMVAAVGAEVNKEMIAATPMGRLGEPEEVADLAAYLTSSEASFVTGQICDVAGGWLMT